MTDPRNNSAVTATFDNVSFWLAGWIAHHKKYFRHIFIWVDDPGELAEARTFEDDRVSVNLGGQLSQPSQLTQLMRRLKVNTDRAIKLSLEMGLEWLLHIDSDELFVCNQPDPWKTKADELVFKNHECCPIWETGKPFRDVNFFKINGKLGFMMYSNGKAAVRCQPGVSAFGSHRFKDFPGKSVISSDSYILHFACCTFMIWFEKYKKLGEFSNFWWDNKQAPITLDFHKRSRDTIRKYLESGDMDVCHKFFNSVVMDDKTIAKFVNEGKILKWP